MEEVLTTGMNSAGDTRPRTGWRQRIKKKGGLSTTIVQQAGSILLEVEKRDTPLGYRAPDKPHRAAAVLAFQHLQALSGTPQARCI